LPDSHGDREVFGSTGSHDRVRVLAGVRAGAPFATLAIVCLLVRPTVRLASDERRRAGDRRSRLRL
jgi:hypothetical protein